MATEELALPRQEMQARIFMLETLAEIASGMVHQVLGLTVREMLEQVSVDRGSYR
jgi:7,8-dihydro-6-hydroxymethylpterin-pyrophosphokinase